MLARTKFILTLMVILVFTISAIGLVKIKDVVSSDQKNGTSKSIIYLFDATGCMADNGKIETAKNASKNSFRSLNETDEAALIVFYDCNSIVLEQPFTTNKSLLVSAMDRIYPHASKEAPIRKANEYAEKYMKENASRSQRNVVLSTCATSFC
jgi:hypothetical protein